MSMNTAPAPTEAMKTCKAACDKAPAGPKKDAAMKHCAAAEKANTGRNSADCAKECAVVTHALM